MNDDIDNRPETAGDAAADERVEPAQDAADLSQGAAPVDPAPDGAVPADKPYEPYVPQIKTPPRSVVRGRRRRSRTPFLLRSPLMYPLLFIGLVAIVFSWKWFTTPIEDSITGQSSTRGQQVQKFIGNLVNKKESLVKSFDGRQQINVLLIGLDHVPPTPGDPGVIRRNDSTLVVSTDFRSKQIRLASIPRDGWVQHWQDGKNYGYAKFGHAYSEGQQFNLRKKLDLTEGGIGRVKETTEQMFEIGIDHYVVIEFEGFMALIDEMGGLEVDVEKDMRYRDRAAGLNIDLKKGLQTLSGEQTMQYARFRKDAMGDKGRMVRQQKVIKLVLKKMATPQMLPKLPQLASLFSDCVKTSLSPDQLLAFAQHVDSYNMDEMESMSLPSYWAREPGHERKLPGVSEEDQKFHTSDEYIAPSDLQKVHEFLTDLNAAPKVVASLKPKSGTAPLSVEVDASRSTDADGQVSSYEFDWNGDGNFEEQADSPRVSHEYPKPGEYKMHVRVLDDRGKPSPPQQFEIHVDAATEQAAGDSRAGEA